PGQPASPADRNGRCTHCPPHAAEISGPSCRRHPTGPHPHRHHDTRRERRPGRNHATTPPTRQKRTGPAYGALTRLERRGWVRPPPADDRRRPYELTGPGHAVLVGQLTSMARIVAVSHRRIAPA